MTGEPIYDDEGREVGRGYPIRTQRIAPTPPPPDHPVWDSALVVAQRTGDLLVARDLGDALRQARR